jgi:transposase
VTVQEVAVDTGGKQALICFFEYIRRRRSLAADFKGKMTVAIFFLDKDIDDILRTLKRSGHLIYTEHYELENYLFIHADFAAGVAAASCLDQLSVEKAVGDPGAWRISAANRWREWIKLCVLAQLLRAPGAYYRRPRSEVNKETFGEVDRVSVRTHTAAIQSTTSASHAARTLSYVSSKVDRLYALGQRDRIFKGKWYAAFAANELPRIAKGRQCHSTGFPERLLATLASGLDVGHAWAIHFRQPLAKLLDQYLSA